jgi:hypothetical protein
MRLTLYALPRRLVEHLSSLPSDFEFQAQGRIWACSREAATVLAPVMRRIWAIDSSISRFDLPDTIELLYLGIFFDMLKGRNLVMSRGNAGSYGKLAHILENEDLQQCTSIIQSDDEVPSAFLDYVLDHTSRGICIDYDADHLATQFEFFYGEASFKKLRGSVFRAMLKSVSLKYQYRRLVSECLQLSQGKFGTIDQYMMVSNPLSRHSDLEVDFDGTNHLQGIIAYMTALSGKHVLDSRAIAIETLYPTKDVRNVVTFGSTLKVLRLTPVDGENMILYDFRERRIALNAVTIQTGDRSGESLKEAPRHWAVLGSEDLLNWMVAYESRGDPHLMESSATKTYRCEKTDYFRFVRFEQISNFSKQHRRVNVINISAIEFFGQCTVL